MGNSSTSSVTPSVSNSSSNSSSVGGGLFGFFDGGLFQCDGYSFFCFFFFLETSITEVITQCHLHTDKMVWLGIKIFILLTGLPANAGLMWLLLSRKRALSASEVLGLNLSVMNILYCLCLPLDMHATLHTLSAMATSVGEALFALNIFGCPVLLTFMCFERYLAAARPVAYMRLGKWEYRAALCACAWILTLAVALSAYFVGVFSMLLYLAITISVLFLLMLLCLSGIVWVLLQSGPGEGSGTNVPLKRRALKNILAVMVPSVVAYTPLVALVPFMAVIHSEKAKSPSTSQCQILQMLLVFPNFGLYIGPLFYMSRMKQLACWNKQNTEFSQTRNTKTQLE